MSEQRFLPFSDQALKIDELSIESSEDQVALYGDINITRDKAGLQKALELKAVLEATIEALQKEDLPEKIEMKPIEKVDNPF
jgi:hypothetical protein